MAVVREMMKVKCDAFMPSRGQQLYWIDFPIFSRYMCVITARDVAPLVKVSMKLNDISKTVTRMFKINLKFSFSCLRPGIKFRWFPRRECIVPEVKSRSVCRALKLESSEWRTNGAKNVKRNGVKCVQNRNNYVVNYHFNHHHHHGDDGETRATFNCSWDVNVKILTFQILP